MNGRDGQRSYAVMDELVDGLGDAEETGCLSSSVFHVANEVAERGVRGVAGWS